MESRFNIPAPVVIKPGKDANVAEQPAIESAGPARGRGGFGRTGLFEPSAKKRFPGVSKAARTVNRHRWVSRIYSGA